jgi:KipI family sensor histidine kinase inhibitor
MRWPRILQLGEAALSVEFGDAIAPELNARVRSLDREIERHPWPGLIETAPTYRSLLVHFDPLESSQNELRNHLMRLAIQAKGVRASPSAVKKVLTVYDGEDLDNVAEQVGLSRAEVVRLHSSAEVMVYMLGFSPGFAYMGLLPEVLTTPRRATPRTRVPAGSVAIAGRQTSVYPSVNPGGWNLIGRASLRLFDLGADPPTFFQPGDRVRFVPTDEVPEQPTSSEEPERRQGDPTAEVLRRKAPQTTVQDLGRIGYQRYGVTVAGAVDAPALRAANVLAGNPPGAAALECTIAGPVLLRFLRKVLLAITGADLGAVVQTKSSGRRTITPWSSFLVREGDILRFTERKNGARAYLAVAGGIDVPVVLGSRSTYLAAGLGGHRGRALLPGDILYASQPRTGARPGNRWPEEMVPRHAGEVSVRVLFGPQEDYFTAEARRTLLAADYEVSVSSDRWGVRLVGPRLEHSIANEIVSDGMMLGAIQVPPDGRPIVMLADRATAGGYPKIATVIGADIPKIAQLMPADRLRFRSVSVDEAVDALRSARLTEERVARNLG